MKESIAWQDLPNWVPGKIGLSSEQLDWKNVALRSYSYEGQDVIVPAMRDFMLVGYRSGTTQMQRRFDRRWTQETQSPGAVSFLTRAQESHWQWDAPVEVTHVYLTSELMKDVASEMFDCCVCDVVLEDVLRTEDQVITNAMSALALEAQENGVGGALYVDALSRGLVIHLLRHHAIVKVDDVQVAGELSPQKKRRIVDFIDVNLAERLDLTMLAGVLGMTPCHFARQFKATFDVPPYAYVIERRLVRAQHFLSSSKRAIKEISADCGFSDQAHLTRLFRRAYGVPPSKFRREKMI